MLAVELLVAGLVVVVLLAALARLAWVIRHRGGEGPITEAQARKNAAPLTRAILASEPSQAQATVMRQHGHLPRPPRRASAVGHH